MPGPPVGSRNVPTFITSRLDQGNGGWDWRPLTASDRLPFSQRIRSLQSTLHIRVTPTILWETSPVVRKRYTLDPVCPCSGSRLAARGIVGWWLPRATVGEINLDGYAPLRHYRLFRARSPPVITVGATRTMVRRRGGDADLPLQFPKVRLLAITL